MAVKYFHISIEVKPAYTAPHHRELVVNEDPLEFLDRYYEYQLHCRKIDPKGLLDPPKISIKHYREIDEAMYRRFKTPRMAFDYYVEGGAAYTIRKDGKQEWRSSDPRPDEGAA